MNPTSVGVDYSFNTPDFNVKSWINNALNSVPRQPVRTNGNDPRPGGESTQGTDASLDASLNLLQTPALDPIMGDNDQDSVIDITPSASSTSSSPRMDRSRIESVSGKAGQSSSPGTNSVTSAATAASSSTRLGTALTQRATTHLTRLHFLSNQISSSLSSTTLDLVRLLPRLTHELDQLRQETLTLQEGIRLVQSDISLVEGAGTLEALDRLKYLDLVKTRMEATHAALREAENWRNLEAEAKEIFDKGDHARAAHRLSEAERSLAVYKNTNEESERMELLLNLKDQLVDKVMHRVKDALERKDTETCQTLLTVFELIGRHSAFEDYYFSQRREPLVDHWQKSLGSMTKDPVPSGGPSISGAQFVTFIQTFYRDTLNFLNDEFVWSSSIFTDPSTTIHGLVHSTVSHLDPPLASLLQTIVRSPGDEASLPIVIAAFVATESFGTRLESVVSQPLVGNQRTSMESGSSGNDKGQVLAGKYSKSAASTDPNEWAYALYEPFMSYQHDYGKLEKDFLRTLLNKATPIMDVSKGTNNIASKRLGTVPLSSKVNLVKVMTSTNNLIFNLADDAIGRCMQLTHGFAATGLLDGLNGFFDEILVRYAQLLKELRSSSGLLSDEEHRLQQHHSQDRFSSPGGRSYISEDNDRNDTDDDEDDDELNGYDDGNHINSALFQTGLRLLVLCRQFCQKLEQLDYNTKKALSKVESLVNIAPQYEPKKQQLLDSAAHRPSLTNSGQSSSTAIPRRNSLSGMEPPMASIALLQQSNLNSFRLQEILKVVKESNEELERERQQALRGPQIGLVGGDEPRTGSIRGSGHDPQTLECNPNHLYTSSHQRVIELTQGCQRFIFDTIYIPLVKPLAGIAKLPCWTEGLNQDGRQQQPAAQDGGKGSRRDIKFSPGPNEYIIEIGQQIRSLPQQFEVYANAGDEGLRFGIHLLPFADQVRPHQPEPTPGAISATTGAPSVAADDAVGADDRPNSIAKLEQEQEARAERDFNDDQDEEDDEYDDSNEAVTHRWITSLARATMHAIVEQLQSLGVPSTSQQQGMVIRTMSPAPSRQGMSGSPSSSPLAGSVATMGQRKGSLLANNSADKKLGTGRISEAGVKQLETDLGYLARMVLAPMEIKPTVAIGALIQALGAGEAGLLRAVQQLNQQLQQQTEQDQAREDSPTGVTLPISNDSGLSADEQEEIRQQLDVFEWVARLRGLNILTL